ncbi:hypothetical protein JZU71_02740, partial [bacterium]|nr:hypothetical protein [bacterium]
WLWDKTKSGASAAGSAIAAAPDKASAFMNRDENINRKNTAINSGLPMALTGASINAAVDTGQKGFLQQGKSAGGTVGGSLSIAGGAVTGGLGVYEAVKAAQTGDTKRGLLAG